MVDIVVYTSPKVLEHKKNPGKGLIPYWTFKRKPRDEVYEDMVEGNGRIFFAVNNFVVGSFELRIHNSFNFNLDEIVIDNSSWKPLTKPIPTRPFRGFRYRWW